MELAVIQSKIYDIRGCRVMLDKDLALIYEVTTSNLNKAVKRNLDRFPDDFMFQLNNDEFNLIFQNGTSNWGGTRKLPYAFTEHGVTMLSGVLKSDIAVKASILIVRAFVAMRQLVINLPVNEVKELQKEVKELKQYVEDVFADQNDINEDTSMQFELINKSLAELQAKKKKTDDPLTPIGYTAPQYRQQDKD